MQRELPLACVGAERQVSGSLVSIANDSRGSVARCLVGAAEALSAFRKMSTAHELTSETLFYPDFGESNARVERAKASVATARLKAHRQVDNAC